MIEYETLDETLWSVCVCCVFFGGKGGGRRVNEACSNEIILTICVLCENVVEGAYLWSNEYESWCFLVSHCLVKREQELHAS